MFINFYSKIDHCSKKQLNLALRHEGFLWQYENSTQENGFENVTPPDVVELWFKLHGKSLTAGEHVYDKLVLMVNALGNSLRSQFQIVRTLP